MLLTPLPNVRFFKFVNIELLDGDKFNFGKLIERRLEFAFSPTSLDGCKPELDGMVATLVNESILSVDGLLGVCGSRLPPRPGPMRRLVLGQGAVAAKRCLL